MEHKAEFQSHEWLPCLLITRFTNPVYLTILVFLGLGSCRTSGNCSWEYRIGLCSLIVIVSAVERILYLTPLDRFTDKWQRTKNGPCSVSVTRIDRMGQHRTGYDLNDPSQ